MEGFVAICFLSLLIFFLSKIFQRGKKKVGSKTEDWETSFGKPNHTIYIVKFSGDGDELVILSKTGAENKMI